jgi:hypothetical protein
VPLFIKNFHFFSAPQSAHDRPTRSSVLLIEMSAAIKETKQQLLLKEATRIAAELKTKIDSIKMPKHLCCLCRVTTECPTCPDAGGELLSICPLHERASDYIRSCDTCLEKEKAKKIEALQTAVSELSRDAEELSAGCTLID